MHPWIIDAKDIEVDVLTSFQQSLFHSNAQIARFLNDDGKQQVLVVGPKGFGKTLLLKVKRKKLEGTGFRFFPANALLDKPIGTPHIFAFKEFQDLLEEPDYWRHVWLISIITSLLKFQREDPALKSAQLRSVYENDNITSCCDIFDRVLALSRNEYFKAYDDLRNELIPLFRKIHSPIAMFVDNVDEYFEQAIAVGDEGHSTHNVRKSFWYAAQVGLASASRELNGLNNHVKICVSIRQEVFQSLRSTDPMAMQLRGSAIELSYEKDDLIEILKKNILAEKNHNLVDGRTGDVYASFFGYESVFITHNYTGEEEHIEEFLLRHSLWRPRDIAALGKRISDIDPKRRSRSKIREVINQTATFIAETYLTESKPHISNLNEDTLYPLLPSNVMDRATIENISEAYDRRLNEINGTPGQKNHIFCQLYRLGLLGYVRRDKKTQSAIQYFAAPGEVPLDIDGIVPQSSAYLVHPILYERISKYQNNYFDNLDSLNIVGRGRPWREHSDILFVLKGDVVGYSEIMRNSDLADVFPGKFREIVEQVAGYLSFHEIEGGDSLILLDRNPHNLLEAAANAMVQLQNSVFQRTLRFGGDAGVVRYDVRTDKMTNLRGGALRTAARLEALGISGAILVTDRFVQQVAKLNNHANAKTKFQKLDVLELPRARVVGDMFNLAKNDSEESILHYVFRYQPAALHTGHKQKSSANHRLRKRSRPKNRRGR